MRAQRKAVTVHPFRARVSLARAATAFGSTGVGVAAFGAVGIGALAIRKIVIKRGNIGRLSIDELEVGRLRVRESIVEEERSRPRPLEELEGHKYISLTTFRRGGEAVPTTLWFALADRRLYATPPDSGKMKHVRNDLQVILTPCNSWGRPRGESVEGLAGGIHGAVPRRAQAALHEKYRLGLALLHLFGKHEIGQVTLEVCPADEEGA